MELGLDPQLFALWAGTFLPILVGVVTKYVASKPLKASLLALFAAVSGVLASMNVGQQLWSADTAMQIFLAWVAGVSTYYGFWKPTGISETMNLGTANFGLGRKSVVGGSKGGGLFNINWSGTLDGPSLSSSDRSTSAGTVTLITDEAGAGATEGDNPTAPQEPREPTA